MSPKVKKIISVSSKVAILILAFIFIYRKLNNNQNLTNFENLTSHMLLPQVHVVIASVIALMLLNWFLESLKWRFLVKDIERISIWKAIESVFCGLTIAIFTPNRIGEYGGRIFFLSPRKRIFGAIAMGVGAVGQMMVTNVTGSLAMLWFFKRFLHVELWLYALLVGTTFLFCIFFILFFFKISWLNDWLKKIVLLKHFRKFFAVLARYKAPALTVIFLFSAARFAVFTTQYYLIIHLLIPQMPGLEMLLMVFIFLFIQSAMPSLDLLDIGVRSMTATYFFGFLTNQSVAIMAAAACIWLINLIIPAIIGTAFVLKLNFFGTNRT